MTIQEKHTIAERDDKVISSKKLLYRVTVEAYWEERALGVTYLDTVSAGSYSTEFGVVTPITDSNLSIWVATSLHKLRDKAKPKVPHIGPSTFHEARRQSEDSTDE